LCWFSVGEAQSGCLKLAKYCGLRILPRAQVSAKSGLDHRQKVFDDGEGMI